MEKKKYTKTQLMVAFLAGLLTETLVISVIVLMAANIGGLI